MSEAGHSARGGLYRLLLSIAGLLLACVAATPAFAAHLHYGWQDVDGLHLFYREGGPPDGRTIVFLHGNPSSSIQYQEVMETLAGKGFHVLAMDYPSFGYSSAPDRAHYSYTFDSLARTVAAFLKARSVQHYALYMQDYGVPVGFRLLTWSPGSISALIVQNGVIHLDGFPAAQDEKGELRQHWQHRNPKLDARRRASVEKLDFPAPKNWSEDPGISPDAVLLKTASAQRPGVIDARNDLWFDYGSNVARYPAWQDLLHRLQPPILVLWGSRDDFFTVPGALAYLREVPSAEVHILDMGHFATLDSPDEVSALVADFAARRMSKPPASP